MNRNKKWIFSHFSDTVNNDVPKLLDVAENNSCLKETKTCRQHLELNPVKQRKFNLFKALVPKSKEDLAVNSKKVKEVELWLETNVTNTKIKNYTPILLLSGPTGCGKTATLFTLCRLFNIEILEWINPIDSDYELQKGPGQTARLTEFLSASKYSSLMSDSNLKRIVVIKDFPNSIIRQPNILVDIIDKCYYTGKSAVVFICTESQNNSFSLCQNLFPQEIKNKFNIAHIIFNPCSTTLIKNALKQAQQVIQNHADEFQILSSDTIEAIIATAMGDIRSALSQFQFACLKGAKTIPIQEKTGRKRKRIEKVKAIDHMKRNERLGLFHGIGRVLNPKLLLTDNNSKRIDCDFNSLIDEFITQPFNFNAFLHENYIKYFGDLTDVSKAAEMFSVSHRFFKTQFDNHDMLLYGLWLGVLGLMVYNEHKLSKWTQIRGPTKVLKAVNSDLQKCQLSRVDAVYYNIITKSTKVHVLGSK